MLLDAFSGVPFAQFLTDGEKEELSLNMYAKSFLKGESVRSVSQPCLGIIIVVSGALRAYMLSEEGREVTLYNIEKGEMCVMSASCVIKDFRFEAQIDAKEDTEIIQIPASALKRLMEKNIRAENFILKATVKKLSFLMQTMEGLLFVRNDKKLAAYLLERSQGTGIIKATHEEIAKSLATAREVVTRQLKQFSVEGYVSLSRGRITINDREGLELYI